MLHLDLGMSTTQLQVCVMLCLLRCCRKSRRLLLRLGQLLSELSVCPVRN